MWNWFEIIGAKKKTKFVFNRCCDPSVRPARVMWSIGIIPHTKQKDTPMMMSWLSSIKTSKGLCPALVAPVQPPNLIEYKKISNEFIFKKTIEIENIKIPPFFLNYLSSNSRRFDSIVCVCVAGCLFLSLSLSLVHMVISKANWIVVDAINAPRSLYALGTLSLLPAI
jgi:hypothetical protein